VDSDAAWQAPQTKMRSPYEFLVATGRLLARRIATGRSEAPLAPFDPLR